MFPLRDINTSNRPHPVTIILIAINLIVLLYELHLGSKGSSEFIVKYGMVASRFLNNPDGQQLFTLLSSTFLHAGIFHCVFNMWFLWVFGDNVEDYLGSLTYLLFYLYCGFSADIIALAAQPTINLPTIGASGAVAGVLGAYIVLHPDAKVVSTHPILGWFKPITIPAYWYLGIWFAMQLISGWQGFLNPIEQGGVAWWAHIGGFLGGAVFAAFMPRDYPEVQTKTEPEKYSFGHQAFVLIFLSLIVSTILTWQIQLNKSRHKRSLPTFTVASVTTDSTLNKSFARKHGWTGTNKAISIPLNAKQSLWIFGHTWINLPSKKSFNQVIIANSAGWLDFVSKAKPVQFFWGSIKNKPTSIINALKADLQYEPMSGALIHEKLYLFAKRLEDIDLLVVDNPKDKPTSWKIRQIPLPKAAQKLKLGTACLTTSDYLYVYGDVPFDANNNNLVVARFPLADLTQIQWQYFSGFKSKESIWSNDFMQAVVVARNVPKEIAITKVNPKIGFVATYMEPQGSQIMLLQAPSPEGPWSSPLVAFQCNKGQKCIAYEAINHPELSQKNLELVVSFFGDKCPQPTRQIPQFVHITLAEKAQEPKQSPRKSMDYQFSTNF
ncbi:MAG: rhomboid family intramembrane serine protease [Candidatus Obscuribacterales bacterium]|nr:rhomboid family intramembrane serine protease [Candidatus Obscuribacterales bacterium]